jgi:hypothetical protein
MPQPRIFVSNAERQKAYRLRKRGIVTPRLDNPPSKSEAAAIVTPRPEKKTHVERSDGRRGQDGCTHGRITWCGKELEKRPYTPEDERLFGDCGGKRAFYGQYPTLGKRQVVKSHPTCAMCQKMIRDDRYRRGVCMNEDCSKLPEPDGAYCVPCGRDARIKNGIAEPEDLIVTPAFDYEDAESLVSHRYECDSWEISQAKKEGRVPVLAHAFPKAGDLFAFAWDEDGEPTRVFELIWDIVDTRLDDGGFNEFNRNKKGEYAERMLLKEVTK